MWNPFNRGFLFQRVYNITHIMTYLYIILAVSFFKVYIYILRQLYLMKKHHIHNCAVILNMHFCFYTTALITRYYYALSEPYCEHNMVKCSVCFCFTGGNRSRKSHIHFIAWHLAHWLMQICKFLLKVLPEKMAFIFPFHLYLMSFHIWIEKIYSWKRSLALSDCVANTTVIMVSNQEVEF